MNFLSERRLQQQQQPQINKSNSMTPPTPVPDFAAIERDLHHTTSAEMEL